MKHNDHVNLLRDGIPTPGGHWADLGSGRGAFTLALAELVGEGGAITSVDRDQGALRDQERALRQQFPAVRVDYLAADFSTSLGLPPLDGAVMANSLHYFRDHERIIRHVRAMLKPGGRLIVVEYNVEQGNYAVPHPVSYRQWAALAERAGFVETRQLGVVPSSFLREFYSALSMAP